MNYALAIERQRQVLVRLVTALFVLAGVKPGASVVALPRHLRSAVFLVLRPAESAARRLIVVAAHVLAQKGLAVSARPASAPLVGEIARGAGPRSLGFALFDPRLRVCTAPPRRYALAPRLSMPGVDDPVFVPVQEPSRDDPVDAERLFRRLQVLQRVLEDLPKQALRYTRLQMRRAKAAKGYMRGALRPGRPPGHRARAKHEVDAVLRECHALARIVSAAPDTS